jgi:hypothetical protein
MFGSVRPTNWQLLLALALAAVGPFQKNGRARPYLFGGALAAFLLWAVQWPAGTYGVNGQAFSMYSLVSGVASLPVSVDHIEEWRLTNNDGKHPFHLHIYHFQLAGAEGDLWDWKVGDWYDSMAFGFDGVRIRFRPDIPGRIVLHCHLLPHEDKGMMGIANAFPFNNFLL